MAFGWPEQPIWPGETRVLGARDGAVDVKVTCHGPGSIEIVEADSAVRVLEPNQELATHLDANTEMKFKVAADAEPVAISVDCEVHETVQLRFEPLAGTAPAQFRIDFDGTVVILPDESLTLDVIGERAITIVSDPPGAALGFTPLEPIAPERQLRFGIKHVYRGPVRLQVSVDGTPTAGARVAIRNADRWQMTRDSIEATGR